LPIIGNSTHEIFLLANPKTQFYKKYTNTKRTNTISIHTKTKTRMRAHIFFLNYSERVYGSPPNKRTESPFKTNPQKASWVRFLGIYELENSPIT
jgi:hypothetical protein